DRATADLGRDGLDRFGPPTGDDDPRSLGGEPPGGGGPAPGPPPPHHRSPAVDPHRLSRPGPPSLPHREVRANRHRRRSRSATHAANAAALLGPRLRVDGPPLAEGIRRPFPVPAATGLPDEPEPVALVEAPRRNVLLEDPQPEPRPQPLLRTLEQRTTDATTKEIRTDVEMLHHVSLHGEEAADLTVRLVDEQLLIAQHDVGDEGERLLVRVDARKERQRRLGGEEEPGDRIGILASRWSDPQPFVHSRSMPRSFMCVHESSAVSSTPAGI